MKPIGNQINKSDFPAAVLFLIPSFLGFFIFILLPILSSFLISFTNYSGSFERMQFTGIKNYELVFSNSNFWQSLFVTLIFVVFSVFFQLLLGFFYAYLLNKNIAGKVFFRSVIFLPVVLSSIAVCMSFLIILHPTAGPVNKFLESIGQPAVPWLSQKETALATIIFVFIWQSFGYYMVIFLSGFQAINRNLFEAADIDGASEFDKLLYITLPGLSPVIFFSFIIAVINAFKVFDQVFILTGGQYGGGPAGATRVLSFDIYINGFQFWQISYGAAEATILFIIVLAVTIVQNSFQKRWVNYDLA